MIECVDLVKRYGDFVAVDGLSFSVGAGSILGLVGPNGAGKTTTMRCLCGVIPPSAGRVNIAGHDLDSQPIEARRAVAFVPDEPKLFEYLTVNDHLSLYARLYGVTDAGTRAPELLHEFELAGRELSYPSELSRGMKQKLMIACALLHRPRALVLDEPLTGLDPGAMRRMKRRIRATADAGSSIIVSSHLLSLVEELCDSILIVGHGRKLAEGTLASLAETIPELSHSADLEEIFLRATEPGATSGSNE